jgi:hypothetical protein
VLTVGALDVANCARYGASRVVEPPRGKGPAIFQVRA